jgi:Xaa-Pro aminopeptidase
MRYTPKNELDARIRRLQERLQTADVDGALIVYRADLFYFSGTIQQAHLYIPTEGTPLLMARKSYSRAREESALEQVVPLRSLSKLADILAEFGHRPRRLGLELDVIPASLYFYYAERVFPGVELRDVSSLIRQVRVVKSPYEVELMREAGRRLDQVLRQLPQIVRPGMSQVAFAGELEARARALGHQGEVWIRNWNQGIFYGAIMAGPDAAVASYFDSPLGGRGLSPAMPVGCSEAPLVAGEPIIVDFTFVYQGYIVDQTRTFALRRLDEELAKAYDDMREIEQVVIEAARPGVTGGELYDLAVERATAMGHAEHFMGHGEGQVAFIGHGIGLEIDELPLLARGVTTPLEPGMVFALEPKVVIPGVGAVGIENNWVVSDDGVERITVSDDALGIIP